MWITVEKKRVFGDIPLGISKPEIKSSLKFSTFPQTPAQALISISQENKSLTWLKLCNYKTVISLTHFFTVVTTTNFKYKSLFQNVRFFETIFKSTLNSKEAAL